MHVFTELCDIRFRNVKLITFHIIKKKTCSFAASFLNKALDVPKLKYPLWNYYMKGSANY